MKTTYILRMLCVFNVFALALIAASTPYANFSSKEASPSSQFSLSKASLQPLSTLLPLAYPSPIMLAQASASKKLATSNNQTAKQFSQSTSKPSTQASSTPSSQASSAPSINASTQQASSQALQRYQKPIKLSIQSIDSRTGEIRVPAVDLRVGESGLVWREFDKNYASIIAEVIITRIESGSAIALPQKTYRGDNLDVLAQRYLPTPTATISKGDMVYFRTLNDKALLIAPTLESYEQVRTMYPTIDFVNSDVLMGYLLDIGSFDPKPKHIQYVCKEYGVGLLFAITTDTLNVLDCQSFIALEKLSFPTQHITTTIAPFFSRIQYAASGSLDSSLRKKRSRRYFSYYDALISQGRAIKPAPKLQDFQEF